MNSEAQSELIKLIVAWTLVGTFVFSVVITCLSLVGLLKFKDRAQQNKLFYVLIVQLVIGCVGFFKGVLQPNPKVTLQKVEAPLRIENQRLVSENKRLEAGVGEMEAKFINVEKEQEALRKALSDFISGDKQKATDAK